MGLSLSTSVELASPRHSVGLFLLELGTGLRSLLSAFAGTAGTASQTCQKAFTEPAFKGLMITGPTPPLGLYLPATRSIEVTECWTSNEECKGLAFIMLLLISLKCLLRGKCSLKNCKKIRRAPVRVGNMDEGRITRISLKCSFIGRIYISHCKSKISESLLIHLYKQV